MAQLSKGETFADSQQLTATRLNQLVDSAQLLVGAITDQPSITANTLEATDTTIVNDAGTLKEATIGDILNSGLQVTSAVINAPATKDIVVTPFDSASVAGSSYVSGDGLTVVVTTLAAHGLVANNVVLISGAGTGYNGTFKITAVTSLTFTYVIFTAATPTASPTACTYVRKASEIVNGNIVATGSAFVGGKLDTLNLEVDADAFINTATINTATIKTANVITAVQYSGVPVLGLTSIDEFAIPFDQANATTEPLRVSTCNQWRVITSLTSQTKTDKEVWVIEADFPLNYWSFYATKFSIHRLSTATNLALEVAFMQQAAAYVQYSTQQVKMKCVIPAGVTFTGETLQLRFRYNVGTALAGAIANVGYGGSLTDSDITKTLRVTKYNKP